MKRETNLSPRTVANFKTASGVHNLARADRRLAATTDQWDRDPWLLNTMALVIDLRTGKMQAAKPEDYMTKQTPIAPDPSCSIELWLRVLHRAMADDEEMVAYMKRLFGYCLTGSTREETLHFFYGPGANGKTKIVEAVAGCIGDYAASTPMETFLESRYERHKTELAALCGARMVTAVETDEGRSWDEAKIKMLTGGDTVNARFMRQDFFDFKPQFTIIIHGNHKPRLGSIDEAIKRRMHLVPFTVTVPKEERDLKLGEKLRAEWPGILAWMVEGSREWQEKGLAPPAKVIEATEDYFESQDTLLHWLEECCERDANAKTPRANLFSSWSYWCKQRNEVIGNQADFYDALERKGFDQDKKRRFHGLLIPTKADECELF